MGRVALSVKQHLSIVRDTANSPFCKSQRNIYIYILIGSLINRTSEAFRGMHNFTKKNEGHDPEIDTAQTAKRLDGRLVLLEKILETFTDSVPNKAVFVETAS